jgi:hypothetical protein
MTSIRGLLRGRTPGEAGFENPPLASKVTVLKTRSAAKRLATRKARGTLGKRQKLRIQGAPVGAVTVAEEGSRPVNAPRPPEEVKPAATEGTPSQSSSFPSR